MLEYKTVDSSDNLGFEKKLNALAEEGWKVIFSIIFPNPPSRLSSQLSFWALMEREKKE